MKRLWLVLGTTLLAMAAQAQPRLLRAQQDSAPTAAENVNAVQRLQNQTMEVKVYDHGGGDPAMNGAYLTLAVYSTDTMAWNVFPLKNVSDYRILPSAKTGYVKIALRTDDTNAQTGNIFQYKSTLFINLRNADRQGGQIEVDEIRQQ